MAPLDGEAQLLLGTLLRRVGRIEEAEEALLKLSRSDSGAIWLAEIAAEIDRIAAARTSSPAATDAPHHPAAGDAAHARRAA
jgi:signal transduction histidine kinase